MPYIRLKISNLNDSVYKGIILRKFFNMVFISEDGKTLTIYTATVFGGMKEPIKSGESIIKPSYDSRNDCSLKFEYEDENGNIDVSFEDLTQSLWKQPDCIEKVWGKYEKKTTQKEVENLLKEIYPEITGINKLNMSADWPMYYINEPGKTYHEFIATHGIWEDNSNNGIHAYTLRSNHGEHNDGIEYMNWVKTKITLPDSLLKKNTVFEIVFEGNKNTSYYTPDFTWYFAPAGGYRVDKDSAVVQIGDERIRNIVQSVTDETTVRFSEWDIDDLIDERKKSRVAFKQYTAENPLCLAEKGKVSINISINNPNQVGNKQFFMGLLVAFLLAFCADKTRMNDFYACLRENCGCPEGKCFCQQFCNFFSLMFPIVLLTSYVSIIFKLKQCVPIKKGKRYYFFYIAKIVGIALSVLLIVYTFGLWMIFPELMSGFVTCRNNIFFIICLIVFSLVLNFAYIVYCTFIRKKKIFDYL